MKWWAKAAIQSVLARTPRGERVHEWLQMRWGEFASLESTSRFDNAAYFLRTVRQYFGPAPNIKAVEIGTGWVPAVPVSLMLAGVPVDTYDVVRLMRPVIFGRCMKEVARRLPMLAEAAQVPEQDMRRRLDLVAGETDFARAIAKLGGSYRAPVDTRKLPYRDGAVDLAVSNLVFQNIHVSVLEQVVAEMKRVLRPGGYAIHRIGMDDEYATVDPGRGSVDFLRYSRAGWDFFCNHSIKYCNRLRCSQFIDLFGRAGFEVVQARKHVDRDAIPRLRRRGVAAEFRGMDWEDLATIGLEVVLRKPAAEGRMDHRAGTMRISA